MTSLASLLRSITIASPFHGRDSPIQDNSRHHDPIRDNYFQDIPAPVQDDATIFHSEATEPTITLADNPRPRRAGYQGLQPTVHAEGELPSEKTPPRRGITAPPSDIPGQQGHTPAPMHSIVRPKYAQTPIADRVYRHHILIIPDFCSRCIRSLGARREYH